MCAKQSMRALGPVSFVVVTMFSVDVGFGAGAPSQVIEPYPSPSGLVLCANDSTHSTAQSLIEREEMFRRSNEAMNRRLYPEKYRRKDAEEARAVLRTGPHGETITRLERESARIFEELQERSDLSMRERANRREQIASLEREIHRYQQLDAVELRTVSPTEYGERTQDAESWDEFRVILGDVEKALEKRDLSYAERIRFEADRDFLREKVRARDVGASPRKSQSGLNDNLEQPRESVKVTYDFSCSPILKAALVLAFMIASVVGLKWLGQRIKES